MSFWRSYKKHIVALCLLLVVFILLIGPMRTRVYHQTYHGSPFIAGFEETPKRGQSPHKPYVYTINENGVRAEPKVKANDFLGILDNKDDLGAGNIRLEESAPIQDDGEEPPDVPAVKRSEPIVPLKNTSWQRHLKKECEKLDMYDPLTEDNFNKDLFKHIIVDDKHKVIYCQIPKVATITWRRIFIVSTGLANTTDPKALNAADIYGKHDNILQYLSDLSPEQIKYKLRHYFKFVFVREPMERLLSAFRNKMLQKYASSDFFRKTLGFKIAMEYRPLPERRKIDPEKPNVIFSEFTQYLTDPNRKVPWNEHWDKYYQLCFPCTIPYDYVGKLENAQRDANYILKRTRLSEIALFPNRTDTTYKLKETKNILKQYYSTLPRSDLRNLIKEYEADRRLFNYKLPDVLNDMLR